LNRGIHKLKFDDPANGLVDIRGGAFFSLANRLPQIVDDELSVCSKVDIVEDKLRGAGKVRNLQFLTPANPSAGITPTVARNKHACIETVANDTDAVVRNSTGRGEQGPKATDGGARGSLVDSVRYSRSFKSFREDDVIAGDGGRRPSVCVQALSHSSLTSHGHSSSLVE
jgi:hypothetical protein